jgi:hypothetical protein
MKESKDVSLSARFTTGERNEIMKILQENKNFGSMSEVLHACTLKGLRYFNIQKELEDPLFVNKIEEQFHIQISTPKVEETFKRLGINEMDAMMAKLGEIREKKYNSLIKV